MVFNDIDNLYIGDEAQDKIYLGNFLVWSGGTPPVPPSPTYVKYIYTTANENANIPTLATLSVDSVIRLKWQYKYDSSGRHIGAAEDANWRMFLANGSIYYDYDGSSTRLTTAYTPDLTADLDWRIDNNGIYDNVAEDYILQFGSPQTASTAYGKIIVAALGRMKIKEIEISKNNVVVYDGKACLNESNVPCLFDEISQSYQYYLGTGSLLTYDEEAAGPPNDEIWYTSSTGQVVTPASTGTAVFGANIVSNTYVNGKGVIKFDGPVTSIGAAAFRNCSDLTSITMPDSVTSFGANAFNKCGLTSITIPNSVTKIGTNAFQDCVLLSAITIGNGVTSIGQRAFRYCSSLTSITCLATTPPALVGGVFDGLPSGYLIYVPAVSLSAYKAQWSSYGLHIMAIP